MSNYKHLLLAVDLADGTRDVAQRARDLARQQGAKLTVLHVVEYMPVEPMGEAVLPAVNMEDELAKTARKRLADLVEDSALDDAEHMVVIGSIKSEIVRQARKIAADLIVIGSHERHGLGVLVNFAEDTVLHTAPCDVLAVRIKD